MTGGAWVEDAGRPASGPLTPEAARRSACHAESMMMVSCSVTNMLKVGGIWMLRPGRSDWRSILSFEAAVIGAPDADGLIKTKAFVVLKEGASAGRGRASALRQGPARPLQIPAGYRLHRRTAQRPRPVDRALPPAGQQVGGLAATRCRTGLGAGASRRPRGGCSLMGAAGDEDGRFVVARRPKLSAIRASR